jgi:hypothetical protein
LPTTTSFDTKRHHIHLSVLVKSVQDAAPWRLKAILDTGAPWTEISDESLRQAGLIDTISSSISIPQGLQTQRYGKLVLPEVTICNVYLRDIEVKVARFDEAWGIDALIGLDFFRLFPVKIDYERGILEVG